MICFNVVSVLIFVFIVVLNIEVSELINEILENLELLSLVIVFIIVFIFDMVNLLSGIVWERVMFIFDNKFCEFGVNIFLNIFVNGVILFI